jgi:hypothetical protein
MQDTLQSSSPGPGGMLCQPLLVRIKAVHRCAQSALGLLLDFLQHLFAFTRLPHLAGPAGLLQLVHPALVIITCAAMNILPHLLHQAMTSREMIV